MNWNKEIPIKWEAGIWIPAYVYAHMIIAAICKESLRLPPDVTHYILIVAALLLTLGFLIHAKRMPRSPTYMPVEKKESDVEYTCFPLFEDDARHSARILFPRKKHH